MDIAIIGAGISGLACAGGLASAGHQVSLFDKGRGPGGRMSTRRVGTSAGEASFDHGAQYFNVRDPGFGAVVSNWQKKGVAARWPAAGDDTWIGVPKMNAPVKHMARRHNVHWSAQIEAMLRVGNKWQLRQAEDPIEGSFDAVIVAVPAEQAVPLLKAWQPRFARLANSAKSAPCWTVMLAFDERLPVPNSIFRDDAIIGWAARNSDKPGRSGPESWVLQASPQWSDQHLESIPEDVIAALSRRFEELTACTLPEPLVAMAHRWRYAFSDNRDERALYDPDTRLGVCSDWLNGSKIEQAWQSGTALAQLINSATIASATVDGAA